MDAKHSLKERIGRILVLGGLDKARATDELKEQIVEMFRAYNYAPEEKKEEVYLRGEKKIIRNLKTKDLVEDLMPSSSRTAAASQARRAARFKTARS